MKPTVEDLEHVVESRPSMLGAWTRKLSFRGDPARTPGARILGLVSATEMGEGARAASAVELVGRVGQECASSAMVLCMHYCAVAVLEAHADVKVRRSVAAGELLGTLAFSENGSRSHFWAPLSTARHQGNDVVLDADKSWVTSAGNADNYVWSSKPVQAQGESTLWLVKRGVPGLSSPSRFDGLGLRGNDSSPVTARGVRVRPQDRLGPDGGGFQLMMGIVLPWFNLLNAACSVGLMEGMVRGTTSHVTDTRFEHLGTALADLPTIRAYLARMRMRTDMVRTLLDDTVAAVANGRADASLRVLESKAAASENPRRWATSPCESAAERLSATRLQSSATSATRGRRRSWRPPPTRSMISWARL
jgi:alkylation response protein AidB-like acyl-CoA dehydrogenase